MSGKYSRAKSAELPVLEVTPVELAVNEVIE
jgi:hypothetical protein